MAFSSLGMLNHQRRLMRRQSEDARQYAYRIIKTCILELILEPGQKVNEADLAASLEISRTPVRDTFIKLSRENLTDIIPQRGAFVSRIDVSRIHHAVWLHGKLGTSMLQTIFIKNVSGDQLKVLYYNVQQLEDYLGQGNLEHSAKTLSDYYRQLYVLAGDMEFVWESLQKVDVDLRRLLYLVVSSPAVGESLVCELADLADALTKRNSDLACTIYSKHLSHLLLLIPPLQQHNPGYFVGGRETAEIEDPQCGMRGKEL